MCGIAGIYDFAGRFGPERLRAIVGAMNDSIAHRGPDDAGVWIDPTGRCALAQRRLSIVDLSSSGHQPMVLTGRDDVALTYNGEIYNFVQLRDDLESQGHRFRSRTDTEVLLHLLAEHHISRLDRLRGMFALGLWNGAKRQLLLARDAFGKKPLYAARGNGWLAFASELQAIEQIPEFDRTISRDALGQYLMVQYCHAPGTIYRSAWKVEPGSCIIVSEQGRVRSARFFEFDAGGCEPGVRLGATYAERLGQLDERITGAVERRLMSDVPLGAFLSGGVDSALIVASMRKLGVETKTYSVGFADTSDTEHEYAREIAQHLGCDHHEVIIRPDAIALSTRIAEALDEPNGDSSCLPTYLLAEFTRRHVTVALSGDGGDEMFGGYGRYFDVLAEAALSESVRPPGWTPASGYLGPRWTIFQLPQIRAFMGEVPAGVLELHRRLEALLIRGDRPLIHRMRKVDVMTYLPGSVLAKVDRMSMQFALEVRCPLLDTEVAAFAAALQADDCIIDAGTSPAGRTGDGRRFSGKRMLKDLLARHLPRPWVDRKKMGFGMPAGFWDGPGLQRFAQEMLDSPDTRLRDHFDQVMLRSWLESQADPRQFSIYRMWPMLMLELWLRKDHHPVQRGTDRAAATVLTERMPASRFRGNPQGVK